MKKDDTRRESGAQTAPVDGGGSALAAVSALMDERRRYESWIEALDARRDVTPEHVFSRVQTDYAARLEAVMKQLNAHSDGLHREISTLAERLDAIRVEQVKERDARAEAELRAHVGEVTAEEWQRVATASDASLGDLATRHDAVETDLANTRALLEAAQRPSGVFKAINWPDEPSVAAQATVDEPAAPESQAAPPEEFVASEPEPAPPPVAEVVAEPAMMELPPAVIAAEQQLLDIEERAPEPVAQEVPVVPEPPPAPRVSTKFDELAFLSSVVDTPSGTFDAAPEDQPDERTRRDTFARRSQEDAIVNLTGEHANIAPVARPSSAEGVKSLKCGECGAMNYPTEWYCERCGAELASL